MIMVLKNEGTSVCTGANATLCDVHFFHQCLIIILGQAACIGAVTWGKVSRQLFNTGGCHLTGAKFRLVVAKGTPAILRGPFLWRF